MGSNPYILTGFFRIRLSFHRQQGSFYLPASSGIFHEVLSTTVKPLKTRNLVGRGTGARVQIPSPPPGPPQCVVRCGGFFVFPALTRPGSFDPHGRGDHHALHLAGALLSNRLSLHAARGAGFSLAPSAQALQHDLQRAQRQLSKGHRSLL